MEQLTRLWEMQKQEMEIKRKYESLVYQLCRNSSEVQIKNSETYKLKVNTDTAFDLVIEACKQASNAGFNSLSVDLSKLDKDSYEEEILITRLEEEFFTVKKDNSINGMNLVWDPDNCGAIVICPHVFILKLPDYK